MTDVTVPVTPSLAGRLANAARCRGHRLKRQVFTANVTPLRVAPWFPMRRERAQLAATLAALERTGRIDFTGEFGNEIATFAPFVKWLAREGRLDGRKVGTYAGMAPFYPFLPPGTLDERPVQRHYAPQHERTWPGNSTYLALPAPWRLPLDYRAHYADAGGPRFEKPVLFIQNKFCVEWESGPVNYLPLVSLERILKACADRFEVVYSRPGIPLPGFSADRNTPCDYPDLALLRRWPGVRILEEWALAEDRPYNLLKLQVLAQSRVMVGVQGGGTHLLAAFGGSLLLVHDVARYGEYPEAYMRGAYKYLASDPPALLLTHDRWALERGIDVLAQAQVHADGVTLPPAALAAARRMMA